MDIVLTGETLRDGRRKLTKPFRILIWDHQSGKRAQDTYSSSEHEKGIARHMLTILPALFPSREAKGIPDLRNIRPSRPRNLTRKVEKCLSDAYRVVKGLNSLVGLYVVKPRQLGVWL